VVALLDQWYFAYGAADEAWREQVLAHVRDQDGEHFNSWSSDTQHSIENTLSWLHQWAMTRQFGLGTRLPWDKTQLVESLSDSTIYMPYYTIAHYLHSDIYGKGLGIGKIKYEQMTDDV
jgi:leucyl-tRNA synthetase